MLGFFGLPDSMVRTLKELAPLASPKLIGLIRWKELLPKAIGKGRSSFSAEGRQRAIGVLRSLVPDSSLWIGESGDFAALPKLDPRNLSEQDRRRLGEAALSLYFGQLASSEGIFIDFRSRGFRFGAAEPSLIHWEAPAPVWILEEEFRRHLMGLYRSFYGGNDAEFRSGLKELGLLPERATPAQAESIHQAFLQHFGAGGEQRAVRFSLSKFNESFERILEAASAAGAKVPGEFAIVGLGLLTLYQTLELMDCEHDVRGIFEASALARKEAP